MIPLLQLRGDAFPPGVLPDDIALLSLWIDLANPDTPIFSPVPQDSFEIRTHANTDGLVPIPTGDSPLPPFPILWADAIQQQPSWEYMAFRVPGPVARARKDDWFFESPEAIALSEAQQKCPIKLGGWPTWIQGSQTPDGADFILQIDATDKGRFYVGDSGSLYVFRDRTSGTWTIMSDFF